MASSADSVAEFLIGVSTWECGAPWGLQQKQQNVNLFASWASLTSILLFSKWLSYKRELLSIKNIFDLWRYGPDMDYCDELDVIGFIYKSLICHYKLRSGCIKGIGTKMTAILYCCIHQCVNWPHSHKCVCTDIDDMSRCHCTFCSRKDFSAGNWPLYQLVRDPCICALLAAANKKESMTS